MKALSLQPNLVEQVTQALLEEVISGQLKPGERIIQEQIAQALGVSRQPVQQALMLLRNQGMLQDAPGRGLIVATLDPAHVRHIYEIRAAIEALACRKAAEQLQPSDVATGDELIAQGRQAVASGAVASMIAADIRFHEFIYVLAGNPLIGSTMAAHLSYTQRVMGEVLVKDQQPRDIWDQHEHIWLAIRDRDADRAQTLASQHLMQACEFMIARLSPAPAA
jgi:DNA-binding GntR family transcriptional regulator